MGRPVNVRADTWGPFVAGGAAACCLGAALVVTVLTAIGLGFVLHDAILIPLLGIFLGWTLWQLFRDRKRHGRTGPVVAAAMGSILTLVGIRVSSILVGPSLAALFGVAPWNFRLAWRLRCAGSEPSSRDQEPAVRARTPPRRARRFNGRSGAPA